MSDWWQRAAIYPTIPRSFQDSNTDGEGDIPGIISRLDYLSTHMDRSGLVEDELALWADEGIVAELE